MRKKRTASQMVAEQNSIRISSHEKLCAERMKTLFKAIDELKKDIANEKLKDSNRNIIYIWST